MKTGKFIFSLILMVIAIFLIATYYLLDHPLKYVGMIGFVMVGFFWNRKWIDHD